MTNQQNNQLDVIETSAQKTIEWIHGIERNSGIRDDGIAYHALRATLHALRDRMPVADAVHFAAQLPVFIRGLYFEGYDPSNVPVKERTKDDFLQTVEKYYAYPKNANVEDLVRAVFQTVNDHMEHGQVRKTRNMLSDQQKGLWPEPMQA